MRNANLDALRAIAILLVLGRHFPDLRHGRPGGELFFTLFAPWNQAGWVGVDLFFVLSGFLISGLLFTEWQRSGSIRIGRFYIRRGFKIYPPFYALMALTACVPALMPATRSQFAAELLFVQNYVPGIWAHTWSLAVEEHFYLLLPVLLTAILAWRRRQPDPFCCLPACFVMVAIASLLLRLLVPPGGQHAVYYMPTHLRMDALFCGVLLGYYRHFRPETFRTIGRSAAGYWITLAGVCLVLLVPGETRFMRTIGFTIVLLAAGCLLTRVIDARPGRVTNVLASVGAYSYSIYLWHMGVSLLVPHTGFQSFVLYIVVCFGVGIGMAKIAERPALQLRDRWFPSRHTSGPGAPPQNQPTANRSLGFEGALA